MGWSAPSDARTREYGSDPPRCAQSAPPRLAHGAGTEGNTSLWPWYKVFLPLLEDGPKDPEGSFETPNGRIEQRRTQNSEGVPKATWPLKRLRSD